MTKEISKMQGGFSLLAAGMMGISSGVAWADSDNGAFELGTVVVTGKPLPALESGEEIVGKDAIARYNRDTVGAAVGLLPGASVSYNGRNEETLSLRGFDLRQVPLFVDGVPLYVPYDGYVDLSRFLTYDLAEIRVAKSDASLLYGPNVLGGAINLVTRKPKKALEGDVRVGYASGDQHKFAANLGSNQGMWYFQLGAAYDEGNTFPLPRGFRDYKAAPTDTGSDRANDYHRDTRLSFKIGITPNTTDEYALGYVQQDGVKGNPVYTGTSTSTNAIRYWQWPYWNKNSIYFISNTRIGDDNVVKTRLYEDSYSNGLYAFTNAKYTTQLNNSSYPSYYDDKTQGASVEWANYSLKDNELRLALHIKEDTHREYTATTAAKDYRDLTTSIALEDMVLLSKDWRIRFGISHDRREAQQVYQLPSSSTAATNGLIELTRALNEHGAEAYIVASRKSRFPTIKDRYSYKMGTALPNPNLSPETANHLETGVRGAPWTGAQGSAAVFYSRISNLIQNAIVTAPLNTCGTGSTTCNQAQNVGLARHQGVELSLEQKLGGSWTAGGNYTYLDRTNLSNPSVLLTDSPRHRLFTHLGWAPNDEWEVQATLETERGRVVSYAATGGNTTFRQLGGFGTLGLKGLWKPRRDTDIELGANNLTNKWYELSDGYPMPGRVIYTNARFRF